MDTLSLILTIAGILISIGLSIYALKVQGSYKKAKLFLFPLSLGYLHKQTDASNRNKKYVEKELKFSPTVTIHLEMGASRFEQNQSKRNFRVILSQVITLNNCGTLTAEDVSIKLLYPKIFSAEDYLAENPYKTLAQLDYGIKRTHFSTYENQCCSIFETSLVPNGQNLEFIEYFLYDTKFWQNKKSAFERSIDPNEKRSIIAFPVYYEVTAKNTGNKLSGEFYMFYAKQSELKEFIQELDPLMVNLSKNYHDNYKRAYEERYWLAWPYEFWFNVLYRNRMVNFVVAVKTLGTVHAETPDPDIVYEYLPTTVFDFMTFDYSPFPSVPKHIRKETEIRVKQDSSEPN